jgi:phosphatidylglycerol:prolipoprotein diacylglycerol transferase
MLLLATISGVLLAMYRARQVGLHGDVILSLAFHMFVGGIVGARLFYIVQYWDRIHDPNSLVRTLGNMLNFVEGGLVVYGSLIGAVAAGLWFLRKQRLPALAVGDLVAPSLALGLAIGRLGCLMNGCCFGGPSSHSWAVRFPDRSSPEMHQTPPYYAQHAAGLLYGFKLGSSPDGDPVIAEVEANGAAAGAKLRRGAVVKAINGHAVRSQQEAEDWLGQLGAEVQLDTDQGEFHWTLGELPDRSLPVHPTQLYSSVNAALLSLLTFTYFPFRRRDGEVFVLLIGLYSGTRFLLEIVRTDEGGLWIIGLTISQTVSIVMAVCVLALAIHVLRQPRGSYWQTTACD